MRHLALIPVLSLGCAASTSPPVTTPAAPTAIATVASTAAPTPPALPPAEAPTGFVAFRVSSPSITLPAIAKRVGATDNSLVDLMRTPSRSATVAGGQAFAAAIDWSKPIDLVALPENGTALSNAMVISLAAVDGAQSLLQRDFDLRDEDGGTTLVPKAGGKTMLARGGRCVLRAAGDVAFRIVCGKNEAHVHALGDFAARTFSKRPAGEPVELVVGSPGSFVPKDRRSKTPTGVSEKMGASFGERGSHAWMSDMSTFAAGIGLEAGSARLSVTMLFERRSSLLTSFVVGDAAAQTGLRDLFLRLPKGATVAAFSTGGAKDELAAIAKREFDAVESEFHPAGEDALGLSFVRSIWPLGGPYVIARGFDRAAATKAAGRREASASSSDSADRAARDAAGAWTVIGVKEPAARYLEVLRETDRKAAALDREKAKASGPATKKDPPPPEPTLHRTRMTEARPADRLPAGSFEILRTATPNPAYVAPTPAEKPLASETSMIFVADGEVTWVVTTGSHAASVKLARDIVARRETLRDRRELDVLAGDHRGGGFVSVAGASELASKQGTRAELEEWARALRGLEIIGARADELVTFTVDGTREGDRDVTRLSIRVPDSVVDQAIARLTQ